MTSKFSGTVLECLRHYASTLPKGSRALGEAKKPLIRFSGANPATVGDWLAGKHPPEGLYLIRVRFFLDAAGYNVTDLGKLSPVVRNVARLIAYSVASLAELAKELGLSKYHTMQTLHGREGVSAAVAQKFGRSYERHRDKLETQLKIKPVFHPLAVSEREHETGLPRAVLPFARGSRMSDRELLLHALANHVLASVPLAERVVSDNFSAEDRRHLRRLAGEDGIFRLKNLLSRLCGETARKLIQPEAQKSEATRREDL